jgi:polyhydroxybutyrate depolymerase
MLHGAGGSTRNVLEATRWDTLAEREGFVVVFPNGTPIDEAKPERFVGNPQTWNSGAGTSLAAGDRSAEAKAIDDVAFLGQLIDRVRGRTAIDGRRIYLAGHSNGAGMAYRFASERPELLAAVGVMAGHLAEGLRDLRSPVSLIAISGDRDPFAPLEGGEAGTPRLKMRTRPARLNSSDWAKANGLPDDPQSVRDDEALLVRQWGPNEAGTEVRWIVVRNHGHAWAGGSESLPESIIGPGSTALDATREMWEFFKAHPKPR